MANKHHVMALKIHSGTIKVNEHNVQLGLPKGCTGLVFCFETKQAAREYWGKDIELRRIDTND